jgi:hypothetical protein
MSELSKVIDNYNEASGVGLEAKPVRSSTLGLPPGRQFWEVPVSFYVSIAKKRSKASVLNSLTNIERSRPGTIEARRARTLISMLKKSPAWKAIGKKNG